MLLKNKVLKQIKHRKIVSNEFSKKQIYFFLLKNKKLKSHFRSFLQHHHLKNYRKQSLSFINRYCIFTSNYKSVSQQFKLTRHLLKNFQNNGKIPGLYKK